MAAETRMGRTTGGVSMASSVSPQEAEQTGSTATSSTGRKASTKTAKARAKSRTTGADAVTLLRYYREMMIIRRFEERAARAYTQAFVGGYCHLNLGEEAAVVGLMSALKPTDYLFTNYREHGYALSRGIDPDRVMAELYGRSDGVSKGWGGSMHIFDVKSRLLGGYGIVGGQLPLATGAALAVDYKKTGDVVMCTMGDGTTNIGPFHESLNIAALWNLPIVYVIINNCLGMGTTVEKSSAEPELYKRAWSYRMASERVDGFDPENVAAAAGRAVESARTGKPFLLEVLTERLKGHSVVDPAKYRSAEELAELKESDPVHTFAARLKREDVLDDKTSTTIDDEARQIAAKAAEFAERSPLPDVGTLFDYTYASEVPNDSRRLPGEALYPQSPSGATTSRASAAGEGNRG
ncbi:MAG TPA: pyruvate dehydrogenase (acetyl-transferring) E1 component subunit alpha [Leifsonia sp.]|jgi:pyruvate dehydrogenase E1 component alpha subunit|nr:pyruvate dehydrogenase (acetyl-transferring) E1 component subunit alpha [Leifsonia sp.]